MKTFRRQDNTKLDETERRFRHILGGPGSPASAEGLRNGGPSATLHRHPPEYLGGPGFMSRVANSFDIPSMPQGLSDLGEGRSYEELNTASFEDMLVAQVKEIVQMRQQEIRKTEENLNMALKELQNVKRQEESLLHRRVDHFKREFKERISELERQFISQAEDLKQEMLSKVEDQKAQCEQAIEVKVQALAAAMKLTPSSLATPIIPSGGGTGRYSQGSPPFDPARPEERAGDQEAKSPLQQLPSQDRAESSFVSWRGMNHRHHSQPSRTSPSEEASRTLFAEAAAQRGAPRAARRAVAIAASGRGGAPPIDL
eukprot:CAMPEP_0177587114 /NCGR_PEP_ID=MMETSP0419_2-20121207/5456_1 /TAXON_ID=582737 /ORGANISM="Tetraselmis sp., Strain GSL018" /LENGTH=313 /DNA_ID=CAMNT_0019077097 /DNA_START=437 /DNA_END=1379 /DNA_ORIENTATION=-